MRRPDQNDSGGLSRTLAVPLTPTFTACQGATDLSSALPPGSVSKREMQSPRLKKEVKPDYTRAAMEQRIEGIVELEAVVSSSGCIKFGARDAQPRRTGSAGAQGGARVALPAGHPSRRAGVHRHQRGADVHAERMTMRRVTRSLARSRSRGRSG